MFTHDHWDHFNGELVIEVLKNNQNCQVYCSQNIKRKLEIFPDFIKQSNRVRTFEDFIKDSYESLYQGLSFSVVKTLHCGPPGEPDKDTENLCYLIHFDNLNILHPGDIHSDNEIFRKLSLSKFKIDFAFLPIWLLNDEGMENIKKYINPDRVAIMHVPNEARSFIKDFKRDLNDYERSIIGTPFIPEKEGETMEIEVDSSTRVYD